jgi:formylglycine-generating enzyme required for sulfatase activity
MDCRSSYRDYPSDVTSKDFDLGFRIVYSTAKVQNIVNELILDCGQGVMLDLVKIPAGKFMMGSDFSFDEKPVHEVTLNGFLIGKYAVTQAQWEAIMGKVSSDFFRFKGNKLPADAVRYESAKLFCENLTKITGREVRLPSEAEWEYACRAGTTTRFSFGDNITKDQVNFGGRKTVDVDSFAPNSWGLYQMHGNVDELCEDIFQPGYSGGYDGAPTDGSAWKRRDTDTSHIVRGGNYLYPEKLCRSASRGPLTFGSSVLGLRVVVSI